MCKETNIFLSLLTALIMFLGSPVIQENHFDLSMILLGASVFIAIYVPIVNINFEQFSRQDLFRHEPMPEIERKEIIVRYRHDHHNYNFSACTEGKGTIRTLEDGASVSIRHVRRWK